jgi:hypothetical protein
LAGRESQQMIFAVSVRCRGIDRSRGLVFRFDLGVGDGEMGGILY